MFSLERIVFRIKNEKFGNSNIFRFCSRITQRCAGQHALRIEQQPHKETHVLIIALKDTVKQSTMSDNGWVHVPPKKPPKPRQQISSKPAPATPQASRNSRNAVHATPKKQIPTNNTTQHTKQPQVITKSHKPSFPTPASPPKSILSYGEATNHFELVRLHIFNLKAIIYLEFQDETLDVLNSETSKPERQKQHKKLHKPAIKDPETTTIVEEEEEEQEEEPVTHFFGLLPPEVC